MTKQRTKSMSEYKATCQCALTPKQAARYGITDEAGYIWKKPLKTIFMTDDDWADYWQQNTNSARYMNHILNIAGVNMWDRSMKTNELRFGYRWHMMMGYTPEEMPTTNVAWSTLTHPADQEAMFDKLMETIQHSVPYDVTCRYKHRHGHYVPLRAIAEVVERDDQHFPVRLVGIHYNMTTEEALKESLREKLRLTEVVSKQQSLFMAKVSHELRTPLNGIIGSASYLQAIGGFEYTHTPTAIDELLSDLKVTSDTIAESSKHMLQLVNDIIDAARLQDGKIQLSNEWHTVRHLLTDLPLSLCVPRVDYVAVPSDSMEVFCDAVRIRQIITQLVDNALKYSAQSQPVEVMLRQCTFPYHQRHAGSSNSSTTTTISAVSPYAAFNSNADRALLITVRDQGCGISQDLLHNIFRPFSGPSGNTPGVGLGMTIVHKIVSLQGGSIGIESQVNQGTTVTVVLPLKTRVQEVTAPCLILGGLPLAWWKTCKPTG